MLAWTAVVVPLHLLASLVGWRNLLPPTYLAGIGWISGLKVTIEGKPHRSALLLGNHLSWLDVMALACASRTAFVAHAGLTFSPTIKWLCEQNGTIFIARDHRRTVTDQVAQVRAALGSRRLTIFLEGTTGDGRELLPFKSALLSAVTPLPPGIPVQPVALRYDQPEEVAWVGDEPGLVNVCKILSRVRPRHLTLCFLDPLAGEALADRKAMAAAARQAIEGALGT